MLKRFGILAFILCCVSPLPSAFASTYIDIEDTAVYDILAQLEAEGVINDALLATRPVSRREAVRLLHEAKTNALGRNEFIKDLVRELDWRLGPEEDKLRLVDKVYAKYIGTNADVLPLAYGKTIEQEQAFNANNDGDLYVRGDNYRAGFISRAEDLGPLSIYLNPEYRKSGHTEKGVLNTGYGVLGFSWIDVIVGKNSQWWGPGYHGAILQSNNAEPLSMVKFTAPHPLTLPWIFKYLGPFQYTLFAARLEEERGDFSYPYLDGLHFDFKPAPWLEFGLERVTILGGSGRPLSTGQWMRSYIGTSGHPSKTSSDYVDTEAGGYIRLTLPLTVQPLQVYWQRDGEDSRMRKFGFPYKYADLYGIYLPRIFQLERIGLRAEYAVTRSKGGWYTHGNYTSGMTYNDMIFGHHMGTDSADLFFELSYRLPEARARVLLSYDKETHSRAQVVNEVTTEGMLRAELQLSEHLELTVSAGYGRITDPGNQPGNTLCAREVGSELRYRF